MAETESIPWKRISVEAVAIVASILLAFAIDAWWAERQERGLERETLIGLLEEFRGHLADMSRPGHVYILNAVNELKQAAYAGSYEEGELSIDQMVFFLRVPLTTDFGSGIREALISSGQIDLISDKALRFEIAEWSTVLDELKDDEEVSKKLTLEVVIPYMIRNGIPMPRFGGLAARSPVIQPGYRALADDPELIERTLRDPQFHSMLEIRASSLEHTIEENDELIEATNSIISKIEAALGE